MPSPSQTLKFPGAASTSPNARIVPAMLACGLALAGGSLSAQALKTLGTDPPTSCTKCEGVLMPGAPAYPLTPKYSIHSDLPEIFSTPGVLYSTRPVLPPFDTHKDGPLSETMRTQRAAGGFTTLDGDFEVFLYHMTVPGTGQSPRRVGVLVENLGKAPLSINPGEIMEADGAMGRPRGPEIRLSTRYQKRDFTGRYPLVSIAPGAVELITLSPRFGDGKGSNWIGTATDKVGPDDRSSSSFLTGEVMAQVASAQPPSFHVHVVGMDAGQDAPPASDRAAWTKIAGGLLNRGAKSGETGMDLRIEPPTCHVRRVAGVYRTFRWDGAATVTAEDLNTTDVRFQMALPAAQAGPCTEAVQTQPMLLSPPYVRPETIGNYMVQYLVQVTVDNTRGQDPLPFDIRFGKQDASIGLSWQILPGKIAAGDAAWKTVPVQEGWAGAWSGGDLKDNTLPFLKKTESVDPGQAETRSILLTVAGSSSLPFQIHVTKTRPE